METDPTANPVSELESRENMRAAIDKLLDVLIYAPDTLTLLWEEEIQKEYSVAGFELNPIGTALSRTAEMGFPRIVAIRLAKKLLAQSGSQVADSEIEKRVDMHYAQVAAIEEERRKQRQRK